MDIKLAIIKLILAVAFAALLQSCRGLCTPSQQSLTGGKAIVFPDVDSIKIGDTLWFNASIPTQIKYKPGNTIDSATYNLSGASNVTTDIRISALKGQTLQTGAVDSFEYALIKGKVEPSSISYAASYAKTVSFKEENGNFVLSFGMIAKKKGIYLLSIIDIYQAEKKCANISVTVLQSSIDSHLHYLQDIYYGGQPIAQIDRDHAYCFKVY